jgi:hypothetical protein
MTARTAIGYAPTVPPIGITAATHPAAARSPVLPIFLTSTTTDKTRAVFAAVDWIATRRTARRFMRHKSRSYTAD